METQNLQDTGLEVIDLHDDIQFSARHLHTRDISMQMEGMRRLTRAFVESPETLLQELVNSAIELCDADSAGISIEQETRTEENFYRWVATAGKYSHFLDATLPHYPSACTICLERGRPQLFRVSKRFFDLMGVEAPNVTDGLLLPWKTEESRGTFWIMSHEKVEAFDRNDLAMMQTLSDFAAMAVRHQRQQRTLMEQASAAAAAAMANELAHQINNPLQIFSNVVYLAQSGKSSLDAKSLAEAMAEPLDRLSVLVKQLLAIPLAAQPR